MGFLDFIKGLFSNGKENPRIIVQDLNKIYKSSEPLEIGLYNKDIPLSNKAINIEINDVSYKRITDENGVAKLNINLGVGKYKASVKFDETEEFNSATAYANVYVNPKITTSDLIMEYKDGSKFKAVLKDNDNNAISNASVKIKINGVEYTRVTDGNGEASLSINLDPNTYKVETKINNITIMNQVIVNPAKLKKENKHFGYWIFGRDMYNVNIDDFKKQGVTDVFLNYYAIKTYGTDKVRAWIEQMKPINVHIWMQCFYDGEWHNPKTTDLTYKIEEAKSYANIEGVAGVHLDYLRYPGTAYKTNGGTEAITEFVRKVRNNVGNDIKLSCAIMPEDSGKYYYGQDITELGKILDFIAPMQYKGNYNAGTQWLRSTTQNLSKQAKVWSGLQAYKSDNDTTLLTQNEVENDIKICLDNGADGVLLFRYGLSANPNFSQFNESKEKIATRMEGTNINMTYKDGTQYQCAVYDINNNRISDTVNLNINGVNYTKTANNEGLYKLNLNLNPGNYTLNATFAGNNTHLGSSISNSIIINEAPKQAAVIKLYDYFTQQGGGKLGQTNGVRCGPHSIMQCYHRLTGIDVSEATLASVCGTTSSGTPHSGIETGIAWLNKTYGTNVKIKWMNFSDLGSTQTERFAKMQELINKGAIFIHLLYRDQYGHYECPKGMSGNTVVILNSLGSYCSYPAYCGYIENRSQSTQLSYINGISQKSVAYMYI